MGRLDLARNSGGGEGSQQRPQQLHVRHKEGTPKTLRQLHIEQADEGYFDSYGYFDIHRTMISDKASCSVRCACCCCSVPGCLMPHKADVAAMLITPRLPRMHVRVRMAAHGEPIVRRLG